MPETAAKPRKQPAKRKTTREEKVARPGVYEALLKAPKKTGRPSKHTPELAQEICERLSTGETMRQICRDEHMPHWTQVYEWLARDDSLSLRVAHAREVGYDALAEEALDIANTPRLGQKKVYSSGADDDSVTVTEEDALGHRKLQIETRLKLLACWNPKKYGNKVAVGGDPGNPVQVEVQSEADTYLAALLMNVELNKQVDANE